MSPVQPYDYLQEILKTAQMEENYTLALKAIELMCKITAGLDKKSKNLTITQLNDHQIQDLINQLTPLCK